MIRVTLVGAALLVGCSGSGETNPDAGAGPSRCGAGEVANDAGTCAPAGVPPERCGAGFMTDGERGCTAVLPAAPCPDGQMAVPGDVACAEPTPCADGRWGDAPVDAATVYVDASYTAADADGSVQRPFAAIAPAIAAATTGSVVAVAAGSYPGDVIIAKPVRLWARCPRLVEITGSGAQPAAVFIVNGASGATVHGVAVRGPQIGIGISGSTDVVIEDAWIHDTEDVGIAVRRVLGTASATLRRGLVDRAGGGAGVIAAGSSLTLDHVEVRGSRPDATGHAGIGALAQTDPDAPGRPSLTILGSFVHDVRAQGISANGADVALDATLVRDVQPQQSDGRYGHGINLEPENTTLEPSKATIASSVVEACHEVGIFVDGSEASIDATVVRDMLPSSAGRGRALHAQSIETDVTHRSTLVLRDALIARAIEFGVIVTDSDATLERVAIADTAPRAGDSLFGDGLTVVSDGGDGATVSLTDSWLARQPRAGLSAFGASVVVTRSHFDCNAIQLDGEPFAGRAYEVEDAGGSRCGCADQGGDEPCRVLTSSLAPPNSL